MVDKIVHFSFLTDLSSRRMGGGMERGLKRGERERVYMVAGGEGRKEGKGKEGERRKTRKGGRGGGGGERR